MEETCTQTFQVSNVLIDAGMHGCIYIGSSCLTAFSWRFWYLYVFLEIPGVGGCQGEVVPNLWHPSWNKGLSELIFHCPPHQWVFLIFAIARLPFSRATLVSQFSHTEDVWQATFLYKRMVESIDWKPWWGVSNSFWDMYVLLSVCFEIERSRALVLIGGPSVTEWGRSRMSVCLT